MRPRDDKAHPKTGLGTRLNKAFIKAVIWFRRKFKVTP